MTRKIRRTRSRDAKREALTLFQQEGAPPEAAGHRQARLEHILIAELQSLITDEATDPSLEGIKVLAVHLSPDGGHARVAYAVIALLSRESEVGQLSKSGLSRATPFLRARMAQHLQLKKLPRLTFTFVGVTSGGEPFPA